MIPIVSSVEFYKLEIGLTFFQEIGFEISWKNPRRSSGLKPVLSKNKDRGADPL
jgi:hypothetical protein